MDAAATAAKLGLIPSEYELIRTRLGREQFRSMFVYNGAEHPHAAQQPKALSLTHI